MALLFSMKANHVFQTALNHGDLPADLRKKFRQHEIALPQNAEVLIAPETPDKKWLVHVMYDNKHITYAIKKEKEQLNIFDMTEMDVIDLQGRIPGNASIDFLRVEMPSNYRSPFARVKYSIHGIEQAHGLRLDKDKRVFLEHFEDETTETILQRAAPQIVELLGSR